MTAPLTGGAQPETTAFTLACERGMKIELQSNRSVCRGIAISDGEVELTADEGAASETNFDDSEWQLSGGVRISFESAVILADQATFRFQNNELVIADVTGSPVSLEDFIAEDNVEVRATAERIAYDRRDGTARLEGEATLRRGADEFVGFDLIYNFNEKSMQSGSSACGVRMRVSPRQDSSAADPPEGS
jgi:lipopolysaccharide transport protein LptA